MKIPDPSKLKEKAQQTASARIAARRISEVATAVEKINSDALPHLFNLFSEIEAGRSESLKWEYSITLPYYLDNDQCDEVKKVICDKLPGYNVHFHANTVGRIGSHLIKVNWQ